MKTKIFLHCIVNLLLILTIVGIVSVSFSGTTASVFGTNSTSPIYRGNSDDCVALMINVYWGTEYLDGMLEVLKKYDIHCTFFVGGYWVAQYPQYLKKIVSDGHEIGNHGYFHKQHGELTYEQNVEEILTCNKIVFEYCGIYPTLFAPPSGDFSNDTLKAASDNGFKTIMWSRDTIDWRDKDVDLIFTRATKNIRGGELILMHPTLQTLQTFEKIVKYCLNANLHPVTVSEIIG